MIIRSPRARNFTIIGNEIFDSGLTLEAIGMLTFLINLPASTDISPQLGRKFCGRDRSYRIFNELINCGYLARKKSPDGGMIYIFKIKREAKK
jgi:hypothetical protein